MVSSLNIWIITDSLIVLFQMLALLLYPFIPFKPEYTTVMSALSTTSRKLPRNSRLVVDEDDLMRVKK